MFFPKDATLIEEKNFNEITFKGLSIFVPSLNNKKIVIKILMKYINNIFYKKKSCNEIPGEVFQFCLYFILIQ
jgi:hypothetical protein